MTALDAHEAIAWDRDNDQQRLDLHRDILETIALHPVTGVREALAGANQVTGQERLERSSPDCICHSWASAISKAAAGSPS